MIVETWKEHWCSWSDGDDGDEKNDPEHEDGEGQGRGCQKRRQTSIFYLTTEAVKRIESKEDVTLTVLL